MLGPVVLEDPPEILEPGDRDDVGDEDRRPDDSFDQPEEERGVQPVLDQAGQADRDHEEQQDRESERYEDRHAPGEAAQFLFFLPLLELGVGRHAKGAKADLQRFGEGDDSADDRPAQHRVAAGPGFDRLDRRLDLAIRFPNRNGPGGDAAHHHPFEHGLTAYRGVTLGFKRSSRNGARPGR